MELNSSREFRFTEQDFEKIRKMIYDYAGIALSPSKHDMVYGRLARRIRALNLSTFQQYLQIIEHGDSKEFELFTNSLTTNLTSFFREAHHFDILRQQFLDNKSQGGFSIWCSASSTGEEPYSIAITACEAFESLRPPVKIIATDLDTNVLEVAKNGVYPGLEVQKLSPQRVSRYFNKLSDGYYQMKQELRDMIVFRRLNLVEPSWSIRGPLDAIFWRNVMIYFDKPTQHKILQRYLPLMKPKGQLFVGHSENLYHASELFKLKGKTVYEPIMSTGVSSTTR